MANVVNTRIQLKNDSEANWDLAENFVPRKGELIIYNADTSANATETTSFPRFKVGDGVNVVGDLPMVKGIGNENFNDYTKKTEIPVQDVTMNGSSIVSNGVATVPIANASGPGVAYFGAQNGLAIDSLGVVTINAATDSNIKTGTNKYKPIVPLNLGAGVFYGLARIAGDNTQSASSNAVGTYTTEAKAAIRTMLDVPSTSDIPNVPVQDVQINNTSILSNGIANIPIASSNDAGVAKVSSSFGIGVFNSGVVTNTLAISAATSNQIKTANPTANATYFRPIVPDTQHEATFYGLSKVAGVDLGEETVTLGTYPASSKGAIQSMLGISDLIAPEENSLVASQAYSVNDIFTANGKLYSVTSAIASGETIIVQNTGETVSGSKAKETNIATKFVKKTDYAVNTVGAVRVDNNGTYGLKVNSNNGTIYIVAAPEDLIKAPSGDVRFFKPLTPGYQHTAVFYGLAKAAGDTTQSLSSNAVGTYTDAAKTAIKTMLGVEEGLKVVRLI